jgi:hypothetical protein
LKASTNIKNLATKYFVLFLILGQLSNAFMLLDSIADSDQIVMSSDMDNNSKEDKNNSDFEEEIKIFENFLHNFYISSDYKIYNFFIQEFSDVLNTEDFPPPELS